MSRTSGQTAGYWITTTLVAISMTGGGLAYLVRYEEAVKSFTQLGYPLYLLTLLGVWKLLGAAVIVAPGLPRLKEWAYAGIVFDLTGAVFSHLAAGEPISMAAPAAMMAGVAFASWRLRPESRRLESLPSQRKSVERRAPVLSG